MKKGIRQDKSYRLCNNRSGESFLLKTGKKGNMTVFDKDKKVRRAIRHCPNQSTIYLDKQDQFALVEPIIFEYGQFKAGFDQPVTQMFLDAHPSNVVNGGSTFEPVDLEQTAKESTSDIELRSNIVNTIIKTSKEEDGFYKLSAVAAVIKGSVDEVKDLSTSELKELLYKEMDRDLKFFVDEDGNVDIFDDESIQRKYIILNALRLHVLKRSADGRSMLWGDKDGKKITSSPRGVDLIDFFSEYLTTDDGILVMEEIRARS
jgi:hypothetical protein